MRPALLVVFFAVLTARGHAQAVDALIDSYQRGQYQAAADGFAAQARKMPEDANVSLWAGKSLFKLRRWNDAVRAFERTVALKPQDGAAHLWLARAIGRKAENAFFTSAFGLARESCREFEAAVRLDPNNLDARFDLLDFYIQAPGIVGGGRDKAEAQARAIAGMAPRAGYAARAEILNADKNWNAALAELVEATAKYPKDAEGFLDLSEFQRDRLDRGLEAEANAQKALALDGNSRRAILCLAAAQVQLRRNIPEALKNLKRLAAGPLTDGDPSFEEVYYWIGAALLVQNDKMEARRAFQTSLGFDPDYRRSKDALAKFR
jgi:tetratricopeptide (TPR) repeat protein